jgi:hypothetical protein
VTHREQQASDARGHLHDVVRQVVLERSLRERLSDGLGGGSSLCVRFRGFRIRVNAMATTTTGIANTTKASAVVLIASLMGVTNFVTNFLDGVRG